MEAEVGDNWEEWEKKKQDLLKFCMEGNWGMVVDMYDKYPSLQNAKVSTSGETALHIAVWESAEDIVHRLVELIDKQSERRWQTPSALWIPNHRGNTPLHLAALIGNVGMCMCIAGKNEELLDLRNKAGETPLFLAALRGKKDAFLYLHQICCAERQYEYHRRHRDGQTILHVAIIGEYFGWYLIIIFSFCFIYSLHTDTTHFGSFVLYNELFVLTDLAYEIICKYDDRLIYAVNEKGCTPLHLLASQPDVFRSGSRLGGFLSRIIYHCETRLIVNFSFVFSFGAGFLVPFIYLYFEILLIMLISIFCKVYLWKNSRKHPLITLSSQLVQTCMHIFLQRARHVSIFFNHC